MGLEWKTHTQQFVQFGKNQHLSELPFCAHQTTSDVMKARMRGIAKVSSMSGAIHFYSSLVKS